MEESVLKEGLFRHSFMVAIILGIVCRAFVLRVTHKQYPTRPQDYLEQIIVSSLASSLGAIALPALLEKEYSALTFFAVAIQQFQGLSQQERITLENIDNEEIVPKGSEYVEEIASCYETRSYISLLSSLVASWSFIIATNRFNLGFIASTIAASIGAFIVALIIRRYLRRDSIKDVAEVVEAKINFDGPILKVNDVEISNIGLSDTRKKYLESAVAIEIKPKTIGDFGIISDVGQRQAMIHHIFIHMGINKDVDEKDILTVSRIDLKNKTVVIPYVPLIKDVKSVIQACNSTPVIETAKSKISDYRKTL